MPQRRLVMNRVKRCVSLLCLRAGAGLFVLAEWVSRRSYAFDIRGSSWMWSQKERARDYVREMRDSAVPGREEASNADQG